MIKRRKKTTKVSSKDPFIESCGSAEIPAATHAGQSLPSIPEPFFQTEYQAGPSSSSSSAEAAGEEEALDDPKPLRSLASLNWPYVPEESAYPDPLKRDDPRPVQLHQYEAIGTSVQKSPWESRMFNCLRLLATSAAVRRALESNPRLPELLTSIDKLRGREREDALQRALGVDAKQLKNDLLGPQELSEDTRALRQLAEAVEAAVRGGREGVLGLDWDE